MVPGYVLSRYYPPRRSVAPGTLYTANLLALPGVDSTAVGSATLRVSADGTQAMLIYSSSGIVGMRIVDHIYSDPYLEQSNDAALRHRRRAPAGEWQLPLEHQTGRLDLQPADILEIHRTKARPASSSRRRIIPTGEISGHFTPANGSQTFTRRPRRPRGRTIHANTNAAVRFLTQATFGASPGDIAAVQSLGYAGWISNQFALPATHHLPVVLANASADPTHPFPSQLTGSTPGGSNPSPRRTSCASAWRLL